MFPHVTPYPAPTVYIGPFLDGEGCGTDYTCTEYGYTHYGVR